MMYEVRGMEEVTIELAEEEVEQLDKIAFTHHQDNREAAIRELLDGWLKARD